MKRSALFVFLLALALGSFAYWGMYTKAGRTHYDEMAGIIPELASLVSGLLFFVFLILLLIIFIKKKKSPEQSNL